ncbi:MAG: glycosyltransferase family 39 protein [Bacteroidales bacterium]|nr:glycosyltransferase family 39 protein [Bacteroidales bacterium]
MRTKSFYIQLAIVAVAALLFIPFLGGVHLFDWDEINFAESAREMLVTKDYLTVQINFVPFWEKPPLFIWMQALSMHVFGINEFAARFPNAICGIVTLLVLFNIGKKLYDVRFGLIWVITYLGALLPFFYFKSGIIDPWFNLFIFLGVYYFYLTLHGKSDKKKYTTVLLSGLFMGLAVLTKGPVGFLVFMITAGIYWIMNRFRLSVSLLQIVSFTLIFVLVGGFWFLLQIFNGNFNVIVDFIQYQIRLFQTKDAGHGGFLLYHFVVLLVGVFPTSIFAIRGFSRSKTDLPKQTDFKKWMLILFWVVLVLFTIVKTKIVHYSSLCYFPMSFLAAFAIYKMVEGEFRYRSWQTVLLATIAALYALLGVVLPQIDSLKNVLINKGYITDTFVIGNLQAQAHWRGFESFLGFLFLAGIILFLIYIRKNIKTGILVLYSTSLFFIFFTILFLTPRVEEYSQHSLIEFFKKYGKKDAYVYSFFKSYAQYFYTDKAPEGNTLRDDKIWLAEGDIDKPVYFSVRANKKELYLSTYKKLEFLYEKNGFVFLVRYPEENKQKKK